MSRGAEEDLAGTASTVRRWLLVEQPGPWGADAVRDSRVTPDVAAGLSRLGRDLRARVLLIRRFGRQQDPVRRTAFAASTTGRDKWVERFVFGDPTELLRHDWSGLAEGTSAGGERVAGPIFLVCTNGAHDACCAELGRPLAAALTAVEPDATWESSHFGGDRFAGNVVCLPDGLYYGRVPAAEAHTLASRTRERRLHLDRLRGRSTLSFPAQAAEIAVRRATGLEGIDDLSVASNERVSPDQTVVTFRDYQGREHAVTVRVRHDAAPRELSCGAEPLVPPEYEAEFRADA